MPDIKMAPLTISEQGSFAVGGTVATGADGQTRHGDHAFVGYQVPVDPKPFPIVMLHGNGQFAKTWESTVDGREGFQTLFLRKGYPVYLVDAPCRGRAGQATVDGAIAAMPQDQTWFIIFRVGIWPDFFPGVQFPADADSMNQYFRQMTPDTAPWDLEVSASAMAALHDKIGASVLVTHSQGGGVGWFTAMKSDQVRGIVSYEPGSNFPFPEDEVPETLISAAGPFKAVGVPLEDFRKLTRMPIVIYYGDFIPEAPSDNAGQDQWRVRVVMARKWAETINRHGGDARVVSLPDIGIHGNTHFPFSDLNNGQAADVMAGFLAEKGLV